MAPVKKNLSSKLVPVKTPADGPGSLKNPPQPYKITKVEKNATLSEVDIIPTVETESPIGGYRDMVFGPKGKLYALSYDRIDIYAPSSSFPRVYESSAVLPFQNARNIQVDSKGKIYVSSYSPSNRFDFQLLEDDSLAYLAAESGKVKVFGESGVRTQKLYFIAPSRPFGQNILAKRSHYVYPSTDRLGLVVSSQSSETNFKGVRSNLPLAYDFDAVGNLAVYSNTGSQLRFLSSEGDEIAPSIEIPYTPVVKVSYSGDVFVLVNGMVYALAEISEDIPKPDSPSATIPIPSMEEPVPEVVKREEEVKPEEKAVPEEVAPAKDDEVTIE